MPVGVVLDSQSALRGGLDVAVVGTRWTLFETPRAAGARSLGAAFRAAHGKSDAQLWVYAWHYVTHTANDGLAARARRTLPGEHGHLRDSEATRSAWQSTCQLAEAAGAAGVILRTPPSFTPGSRARRALRAFVSAAEVKLAWEPEGLWEPDEASALAAELDVTLLSRGAIGLELPGQAADWVLIEQRLSGGARDAVAEGLEEGRTVLFAGDGYRDARRALRDLANL